MRPALAAVVLAHQARAASPLSPQDDFTLMSLTPVPAGQKQAGIALLERRWASFCEHVKQSTCLRVPATATLRAE